MEHVRDAWVRGVTFRHFAGSAVSVWESASRVTVVDCMSLKPISEDGGWRRHTFFTAGQQTLFLRCLSERGRHDFSVGHCAAGPNAFVHCDARMALEDSGPIGAWATGVLYDNVNIDGHGLRLSYRGTELQFSGWTAVNCMLWQCTAAKIECFQPPMGQNWAIGCWADFPWRSANNINDTGFPEPPPYAGDKRIFQAHLFYDVTHAKRRALHRAYIRHHLEVLKDCPNVIHMTSAEYTGPLAFTQFWLDTIGQWEQETGKQVLTALSCTYDVQEAVLNDPARAAAVDVIDIRYWTPKPDGSGSGPEGGINLSPRQQGYDGPGNDRNAFGAAVKRYQQRFPEKAVICSAMGFQIGD